MAEQESEPDASAGTICHSESFDRAADAKALFDATEARLGTKEKVITDILTKRTNSQRQDIIEAYMAAYDKDLIEVMRSELSGHYLSVVEGLLDEPPVFLAKAIHKYSTDTSMLPTSDLALRLIEIIFPLNYIETSYIKEVYQKAFPCRPKAASMSVDKSGCGAGEIKSFGTILDADIALNVFGPWKSILLNVETGHRHETVCIDDYKVDQDVKYLLDTPIDEWALPNSRIEDLLIRDSFLHLQKVFRKVNVAMSEKGKDLIEAINTSSMIAEQREGFLAIVYICLDYARFNASVLHKAMSGLGTDDDTLIRVIVSRCEIDLEHIKTQFKLMYGKTLREWVSSDTSGDYRDILLAIIGK